MCHLYIRVCQKKLYESELARGVLSPNSVYPRHILVKVCSPQRS